MADTNLSSLIKVAPLLDEDNMASDSAAHGATQQSIKAYVDTHGFVDRGDPAGWDWQVGDLTTDATWRDLDLSAIVPAGAKAVMFRIRLVDDVAGTFLSLRENGNSNALNVHRVVSTVATVDAWDSPIIACDTNRVVEYYGSNVAFTTINIVIAGWWF